jgi:hypothetical protein
LKRGGQGEIWWPKTNRTTNRATAKPTGAALVKSSNHLGGLILLARQRKFSGARLLFYGDQVTLWPADGW